MNIYRRILIPLGLLLLTDFAVQTSAAAAATETIADIHWLGLKQISADTNSAQFMKVWQLPETVALMAQTLDKLSRWPGGATNAAGALLRPLLDDLVSRESYLEVCARTNFQSATRNPQFLLALRLPAGRARLWQTNLAAALEKLTGTHPAPDGTGSGWLFQQTQMLDQIKFSRGGEWTLMSVGHDAGDLVPEFSAHITRKHTLFAQSATNFWLEADFAPSHSAGIFSFFAGGKDWDEVAGLFALNSLFSTLDRVNFTVIGNDGNVITHGIFDFSHPLDFALPSWEIPTNFIHQQLTSFLAVRGIAPWLATMPAWQKLQLTPPPNQAYLWSEPVIPFQTYFVAPLPGASNQLYQLAGRLVKNANPWLATNGTGSFQWVPGGPGIFWNDVVIISPFLQAVGLDSHDYVVGGLYPRPVGNTNPPPADVLHTVLNTPDLIYYQSELTGSKIEDDLFINQLFRVAFHKAQLPPNAAGTRWLKHIEPLLGGSVTFVTQKDPEQLAFSRKSTVGFSAFELHLLVDWLESPQFPHGLHTFLAPPDK
jgi:hypothetical protein